MRNIAAAQAIASGERTTTFLTLYDERNPYFTGSRQWPGWIIMLSSLMRNATTAFAALSWQELVERVEFDEPVRRWATDKHGLLKERQR